MTFEEKSKSIIEGAEKLAEGVKIGGTKTKPFTPKSKTMDERLREMVKESQPGREYTLEEIGDKMGVTRERIRQIEGVALRKLYRRLGKVLRDDGLDVEEIYSSVSNATQKSPDDEAPTHKPYS